MEKKKRTKLEMILFTKRISQIEMASEIGMYNTFLNMIVKGHRKPNSTHKRKICKFLGMQHDDVF